MSHFPKKLSFKCVVMTFLARRRIKAVWWKVIVGVSVKSKITFSAIFKAGSMLTLLISLCVVASKAEENYCTKKVVDGITYSLKKEYSDSIDETDCNESLSQDENSKKKDTICFHKEKFSSNCYEQSVQLGGCIGVLAFIISWIHTFLLRFDWQISKRLDTFAD